MNYLLEVCSDDIPHTIVSIDTYKLINKNSIPLL